MQNSVNEKGGREKGSGLQTNQKPAEDKRLKMFPVIVQRSDLHVPLLLNELTVRLKQE